MYIIIFADQVFIDPTFFGIFVCGPLQSFMVNVCNPGFVDRHCLRVASLSCVNLRDMRLNNYAVGVTLRGRY